MSETPLFLLYGGNGWIGKQIQNILIEEKLDFQISKTRADNKESVENEIKTIKPTHIISTVGRTYGVYNNVLVPNIDYLEKPNKLVENVRDNLYGPLTLAELSSKYDIHFTYLGTGCIYEYDELHPVGDETTGFNENDKPNFTGSSYSTVKGFTDQLMDNYKNTLNVRIRMPITDGKESRDFISKIMKYEKVCNMPNSMSVLPVLLPIMVDMALKKVTGKINMTNPGLISHNQILEMYKKNVDNSFTWKNFTVEEQDKILDSRRSNNCLDTTKLELMYPDVLDINSAVLSVIKKMK